MTLERSNVWINKSKSGNGFTIRFGDEIYTGPISALRRFVDGEIEAVNLSLIVPDEEEEE